jgi:outer membrane protein assembly factor BamD (BamD/ComL family)
MLLDEARAALVQGDASRALERLDQHQTHFPDGLLAEERDAMQVQALVRAERYDEARARAATFRARSPSSLFLSTVESAIGSIP